MQGSEDLPGLIPLSVATILSCCIGTWCSVEISYYEVYMERCYDLLEPMTLYDKFGNLRLKGLAWVMHWLLVILASTTCLRKCTLAPNYNCFLEDGHSLCS
uniref:Kinesin motor domain-containing protein n=1 Tax=Aegilops tauschii subsp. strangulata TaxID=200361 RepID=A0A453AKF6_AEGTS